MTKEITPARATTRGYSREEKDQAVRLVFELHKVLDTTQGTVIRIADQLGYGTQSPRCDGGGGGLPVSARHCPWGGFLVVSQDAFH